MKTKHPIGPKKKHYQDKKRQLQHDENVVTPNKSRRSNNNVGDVSVLKDKGNTSGSRNLIHDMNKVLLEMNSELVGSIATAALLLTKAVELLQSVHGNRHAVRQLVFNLINQHVAAQVDVAAIPLTPPQTVPVLYDKDIFQRHQWNTAIPVPLETGRTNMKRSQKRLLDALDTCGTLQHQMFL